MILTKLIRRFGFGNIEVVNGIVEIKQCHSEKNSNAKNIRVFYDKETDLYKTIFESYKKIFVCSNDDGKQSDVMITQVDNSEDLEIDKNFMENLKNEVLELIQYDMEDFYIDTRKNQYTGDRDTFIFLKKGNYKLRELSIQVYWTNNIFIETLK